MAAQWRMKALVSAMAATGMAGHAVAQDQTLHLDRVVVSAAGYEQKITDAPASISVIGEEELQRKRYSNLAEALEGVEGVDIRQGTGKTGGLNISMRGLPSEYTLFLIDGRRQNTAGSVAPNGFGETTNNFMPPMSAIERIEVIRGPMSTLYGSDAMGGVVNIITKKVADTWGGSVSLDHTFQENRDYGSDTRTNFYVTGPLAEGLAGLAIRGSLYDRQESDLSFDNNTTVTRRGAAPVEGRNYNIGARLTLTPHDDHDLSLDFERSRQVYNNDECQLGNLDGWDSGDAVSGCNDQDPTVVNGYKDELRFERDQLVLSHEARLGVGNVESSLTYNVTETLGRTVPGTLGVAYTGFPDIVAGNDRKLESTDLIFDTKLVTPIGDSHLFTLGGQWWDAEVEDGVAAEKFSRTSWAVFVENEWRIIDSVGLTLGARYEDYDSFGGHVSPRAYVVWNVTDNWTAKGGISRGYKAPSLNEMHDGISGVSGQGQIINIGSPHLDPEITTNTEVALYYDNYRNFNANITLFHNKFKDKIASGPDLPNCHSTDPDVPPNLPGCVDMGSGFGQPNFSQSINVDEAMTRGMEIGGRWAFAPRWSVSTTYTWTDSEQKSGPDKGAPLTNTPKHLLYATVNWEASDRLNLWLRGEYRSERDRFTNTYTNLSEANKALVDQVGELEAYEVFHLGGSYRATDNLTLSFAIYNLFDKDFLKGSFYTTNSGAQGWASDYIQSGRSVTGTLEESRRLWLSATLTF